MHSLIHNQLSAPVVNDMIRYSWFRTGYISERILFRDVMDVCFSDTRFNCGKINCLYNSFIQCSHCSDILFPTFFSRRSFSFL